jgi:hypothetical protein
MAQNQNIGLLGQYLTVNTTANSILLATTAAFYNNNGQANIAAGAFVSNAYATLGGYGGNYLAFGQQTTFAQWIQSGYSSAGGPVYYHILLNPLGGNIGIGNTAPSDRLSVNGTTFLSGNVILGSSSVAVGLQANGGYGTSGQVLTSNGTATYWAAAAAGTNVAAQYAWTNTQSFSNAITFNSGANLVFSSGARIIDSTASQGTVGQVLTSNGVGNVYWSTVTGVNVASQYTFTNTITHNANLSVNGAIFLGASNGQVGQVLTSNGTGNVYWSTVSSSGQYTPRVSSTASASSVTPTTASYDMYVYTALAATLTINASTFLPTNGTKLMFRFKDNGTAQTLTWTTTGSGSFRIIGTTLPTATTVSKVTYVGCVYNSDESYWDVIAVGTQA